MIDDLIRPLLETHTLDRFKHWLPLLTAEVAADKAGVSAPEWEVWQRWRERRGK